MISAASRLWQMKSAPDMVEVKANTCREQRELDIDMDHGVFLI
jgi:hypothetical protein